jgi:hypothetical protein
MAEKRVKIPFPDQNTPGGTTMVEGNEVAITESTERWSQITLEDGTVMRVKPNVLSAIRIDGRFDNEGNPLYALKGNQIASIVSAPDHLKKPIGGKVQ